MFKFEKLMIQQYIQGISVNIVYNACIQVY